MDNYTYQHCVNVAILSLMLGIQLNLKKQELYDLCMGGILHDVGKIFIDREIIQKPGRLSFEEMEAMKQHSFKGYEYLKDSTDISSNIKVMVLQHHEKFNGQGYPDCRKGEEINKLARVVSIADVYDALTSDRPYRKAMSPNDALEYIMAGGDSQFDYKMVRAFSKMIVPYPEGTIVRLSNNDIALVEEVDIFFPLRPKVKVIKSLNPSNIGKSYDLEKELNIVIIAVQYEIID